MAQDYGDPSGGSYHNLSGLNLDAISAIVDADHDSLPQLKAAAEACRELRDLLIEQRDVLNGDLDTLNANYSSPQVTPVVEGQFTLMTDSLEAMIENADAHHYALDTMATEVERVKPVIDGLKSERDAALGMHSDDPHAFDSLGDPNSQLPGIDQVQSDIADEAREELETASIVYQIQHTTRMDEPPVFEGPTWNGGSPDISLDERTRGYDPGFGGSPAVSGPGVDGLDRPAGGPDLQGPGTPAPAPTTPAPAPTTPVPSPGAGPSVPPVVAPPGGSNPVTPPAARPPASGPVGARPPAPTTPSGPRPGTPGLRPGPNQGTPGARPPSTPGSRPGSNPATGRPTAGQPQRTGGTSPRGTNPSAPGRPGAGSPSRGQAPTPNSRTASNPARPGSTGNSSVRRAVVPQQSAGGKGKAGKRNTAPRTASSTGRSNALAEAIARDLDARTGRGVIGDRGVATDNTTKPNDPRPGGRVIGARRVDGQAPTQRPGFRAGSLTGNGIVSSGLKEADRTWTRATPMPRTEPGSAVIGRRVTATTSAADDRREARAKRRQQRRDILAGVTPQNQGMEGEWFDEIRDRVVPGVIGSNREQSSRVSRRDIGRYFGPDGWKG
ncbi:hypothetical protein [Stackebrandtia soli]|uniref:hypothetical protein n=1 Tax=Stackebrandtia soli TaxID=1892856 RepID=UPI0039E76997